MAFKSTAAGRRGAGVTIRLPDPAPLIAVAERIEDVEYPRRPRCPTGGNPEMKLLVVYVALVAIGAFVSYGVGYMVESASSSGASLLAFLSTYFLTLGISWFIAVRLTAPSSRLA
jgi:hypothetical protein